MSEQTTSNYHDAGQRQAPPPSGWATGFIMFAGVMMIMAGGFQSLVGLAALIKDDFYVSTPNYLLEFDPTNWGWIHLLMGLLVLFAGFAVLNGRVWGRTIGVILAVLSALVNFAFIPYYPFWSILVIAVDIFVIWALTAHGRDITR
ncbi:DUF7144 family membrane protein [Solicola gregarius]|uniref:DUF7144 domain-containing protein n=1 Tax=Solicola gregarius TaxID=2908642 RepID=A0AA46TI15_9ACTN|nr:hypothetical protein [Solicola gregarius]UYM05635.1 hypothetical protein L0C25_00685 [Solicola gregarius]